MTDPIPTECRIDGFGPLPVVAPQSVAELSDAVRRSAAANQAIYPLGGRTMLDLGLPPSKRGIAVDLTRLAQVIDYPARDMTITVQAGITIARLQSVLAAEKQQLPVDVPLPERATLGGALAVNCSGPRRYGYGTLRDYVIGISVVNDQGHEVKAGGRVVKNVAGYDMCKLYIGSLGTLGVITQVTLKLRPLAEDRAILSTACSTDGLPDLLNRLHTSATRPVCISILAPSSSQVDYDVGVGLEDNRAAMEWQVNQLQREFEPTFRCQVSRPSDAQRDFHLLGEGRPLIEGRMSFKASVRPSALAEFLKHAREVSEYLEAYAGNGIVLGQITGDLRLARAQAIVEKLQGLAASGEGNVVILRCPVEWKPHLPIWGRPRGDTWLMRAIKEKLDPGRLFNPGRFVDGL